VQNIAYFEDLEVGQSYETGPYEMTRDEIIEFARHWDSREFHVDEQAARKSVFGGLVASGAHTFAVYYRLSLESGREAQPHAVKAGLGFELRLPEPVRPGDALHYRGRIIELRDSASHADAGIVRTRHQLLNQSDVLVLEVVSTSLVLRHPA
jgi:acyl dehydratase